MTNPDPSGPHGRRLEGRVALITGASRGLGAALAIAFAREGAHPVLLARTVGGLEEVDDTLKREGRTATLVPMDLNEGAEIEKLGPSLYQRFGRLDVVVANAARLGTLTPAVQQTPKDWQQTLSVNLTANQRLLASVDPLLKLSPSGRAIFVSCAIARAPRAFWSAYAVSKAGLETLAQLYAAETRKTPLRVNLIDPGPMATRLRRAAFPGEAESLQPAPETRVAPFIDLAAAECTQHGELIRPS